LAQAYSNVQRHRQGGGRIVNTLHASCLTFPRDCLCGQAKGWASAMGQTSSQPACLVEVSVHQPSMASGPSGAKMSYFACLHTACDGHINYSSWGSPQLLGLWADDVITVSLYMAQSEHHFHALMREEIAETYLPWEAIADFMRKGEEVSFCLGLNRDRPWLRHTGTRDQYLAAFNAASTDGNTVGSQEPSVTIGVRAVQHLDASPLLTTRTERATDTSKMQTPRDHRPQLAPSPAPIQPPPRPSPPASRVPPSNPTTLDGQRPPIQPETEEQAALRLKMNAARVQNERIRTELYTVEREFEMTSAALNTQLAPGMANPGRNPQTLDAEVEELRAQVENTNLENIHYIRYYDEQIRDLEAKLEDAREVRDVSQPGEAVSDGRSNPFLEELDEQYEIIHGECEKLQVAVQQEITRNRQEAVRKINAQRLALQMENEVQLEQLRTLRALLDTRTSEFASGTLPLQPPSTAVLQDEVTKLRQKMAQVELQAAKEANARQREKDELRSKTQELERDTERILLETKVIDDDVARIRSSMGSEAVRDELRERSTALAKEVGRAQQRLSIDEERIKHLRQEAVNIRQRSELVQSSGDLRTSLSHAASLQRRKDKMEDHLGLAHKLQEELNWEKASLEQELERLRVGQRFS